MLKDDLTFEGEPPPKFALLSNSYRDFVDRSVEAGFQVLKEGVDLPFVDDEVVYSGAFAVAKDETEDRFISPLEMLNFLTDGAKMDDVSYPYIPALVVLDVPLPPVKLYVSKRDARNYYPSMACGEDGFRGSRCHP